MPVFVYLNTERRSTFLDSKAQKFIHLQNEQSKANNKASIIYICEPLQTELCVYTLTSKYPKLNQLLTDKPSG